MRGFQKFPCLLLLFLGTHLGACSGTDVGNASPQLQLSAETVSGVELSSFSVDETVFESVEFQVRQVSIPPQSQCGSMPPPLVQWWRGRFTQVFNLTSGPLGLDVDLSQLPKTSCQIRFVIGPSSTSLNSLRIAGTQNGTAFEIRSSLPHLLVLKSTSLMNFETLDSESFHSVLKVASVLDGIDLSVLGPGPVVISPSERPVAFELVLRNLRRNARLYPLLRSKGSYQTDRNQELGEGDENETNLEDDEYQNRPADDSLRVKRLRKAGRGDRQR